MSSSNQLNISDRFVLHRKLGQGTFSKPPLASNPLGCIYEALDKDTRQTVALKVEKKDKNKNILKFEYSVIKCLKGKQLSLIGVCRVETRGERI